MNIIISGPPGSGKTTLVNNLKQRLDVVPDVFPDLARSALKYKSLRCDADQVLLQEGLWRLYLWAITNHNGAIFDYGFVDTLAFYSFYDSEAFFQNKAELMTRTTRQLEQSKYRTNIRNYYFISYPIEDFAHPTFTLEERHVIFSIIFEIYTELKLSPVFLGQNTTIEEKIEIILDTIAGDRKKAKKYKNRFGEPNEI